MEYESISHGAQPQQLAAQTGGRRIRLFKIYGLILNWIIIVSTRSKLGLSLETQLNLNISGQIGPVSAVCMSPALKWRPVCAAAP